jgi:hypothetical protein
MFFCVITEGSCAGWIFAFLSGINSATEWLPLKKNPTQLTSLEDKYQRHIYKSQKVK